MLVGECLPSWTQRRTKYKGHKTLISFPLCKVLVRGYMTATLCSYWSCFTV